MRETYEVVIGLEVHAQLKTKSKLFCGCSTQFGDEPNSNTCPVCLGLPGALPVINRDAVRMAAQAAAALGCRINLVSIFARKNYFYPDLPKAYQISQYDRPFSDNGIVEFHSSERDSQGRPLEWRQKAVHLTRLHIEEDAGKSIHDGIPDSGRSSFVDLNRSGVPLAEIVSEPELRSSWEAYDYLQHLRQTLQFAGACDGNMEEGNLRCDANVSVRLRGTQALGTKVEVKNLNSFRFVQKALEFEIGRQIDVLESGGEVAQETRLWDERGERTYVMRTKEDAHDYRYFPEPDLPPLIVSETWIEQVKRALPELPGPRKARLVQQYGLSSEDAATLVSTRETADFFEAAVEEGADPRSAANWMLTDLTYLLKTSNKPLSECLVSPKHLAGMIKLVSAGTISGKMAKSIIEEMFTTGKLPDQIVVEKGLVQISDSALIEQVIRKVLQANPEEAEAYRAGKEQLLAFFVGQVMKETRGKANPRLVNEVLRNVLGRG